VKNSYPEFSYNMTMEQASYIKDSVSSVAQNAVVGCILAIFILLLFLGSIRTSITIGISMPISVITTFVGMYFSGMSLNVVSLGGLALGVGMLVDNSVVVLENIFRRRKEYNEDSKTASILGSKEVVAPVVASVLTTCIVYVPIMFINNIMSVMFKQLAFSIIFSQIASLITTFLLLPMLLSKIDNVNDKNLKLSFILNPFEKLMDFLYSKYDKLLRWCLKFRKVTMTWVIIAFMLSLFVLSQLGMILMPSSDEGNISVSIELPDGFMLENTNEICKEAEKIISENENVKDVFSRVGYGGVTSMLGGASSNMASITVTLNKDRKATTEDVVQQLRESLSDISGAVISINSSSTAMSSMSSNEIEFQFSGDNDEQLEAFVFEAKELLSNIEGVEETSTSLTDRKSEVKIKLNPSKAARFGMNTAVAANLVKGIIEETKASKYTENSSEYDIVIKYPENYVANYNELKNLQLKTATGQWIALSDIADISVENGYTTLSRVNQKRVITLSGKLYNTNMSKINNEFNSIIEKKGIPEGISIVTSGTYDTMIDAMKSLLTAILLGILLMYMVMAAQFESLTQPLIILGTVPLAIIGVVLSLAFTWSPLSVVGCIGILMLVGIVVNNAIVLIDFVNNAGIENPDMSRTDILVYAGRTRMRPILMTSLTSILGFLPMAISRASGSEMMQPLARVLIGGLLVGTLLTLFIIPIVYTFFDDKKVKRINKKALKNQL
ncbi:MAG: efflux RND transporter permease subunit, partial [Clostridia bacterium]|nr:efflux RND transporter permease subunit [Clostridia bacterium]